MAPKNETQALDAGTSTGSWARKLAEKRQNPHNLANFGLFS